MHTHTHTCTYVCMYVRVYKYTKNIFLYNFLLNHGVGVEGLNRWTTESQNESSNSTRSITFTFGKIPLGKAWTPLSSHLCVKYYHCPAKKMDLVLNNLRDSSSSCLRERRFMKEAVHVDYRHADGWQVRPQWLQLRVWSGMAAEASWIFLL